MPSSLKHGNAAFANECFDFELDIAESCKAAIVTKRDADHRIKWRYGDRNAEVENSKRRPFREEDFSCGLDRIHGKRSGNRGARERAIAARRPLAALDPSRDFAGHMPADSRTAGEILDGIGSPSDSFYVPAEPWEAQVMYSYDAPAGPSDGQEVLGEALMRAVEHFEDKKTKTLVKEEYNFISDYEEDEVNIRQVEEDFEMLF